MQRWQNPGDVFSLSSGDQARPWAGAWTYSTATDEDPSFPVGLSAEKDVNIYTSELETYRVTCGLRLRSVVESLTTGRTGWVTVSARLIL